MGVMFQPTLALAAAYLRRSPVTPGRWRLLEYFLPQLRKNGSALGNRVVRTRYGFRYQADLGDWLGQYVYLTGCYEPATARVIADILRPGDTFIDVGANSGFFTLLAAHRVGASGHVLAFEPIPLMRERLQENIALNRVANVVVHDVALSDVVGECLIHEGPTGHKGLSSLRPIDNAATRFPIKTLPLDTLITPGVNVTLIKIDVEGAEHLVINGMRRILEQQQPSLVIEVTEKYLAPFGHSAVGLCQSLCGMGYHMYRIDESGLVPMDPTAADTVDQFNALFTRQRLPADPH